MAILAKVEVLGKQRTIDATIENLDKCLDIQEALFTFEENLEKESDFKIIKSMRAILKKEMDYIIDIVNKKDVNEKILRKLDKNELSELVGKIAWSVLNAGEKEDETESADDEGTEKNAEKE